MLYLPDLRISICRYRDARREDEVAVHIHTQTHSHTPTKDKSQQITKNIYVKGLRPSLAGFFCFFACISSPALTLTVEHKIKLLLEKDRARPTLQD